MSVPDHSQFLGWITRLQAIAQNGLTFARDPYDVERYTAIREIAAEMLGLGTSFEVPVIRRLFASDSGYATPKVDVRGVVFRGDAVLLVREKSDGCWTLPGGWADVCESPAENVVREIHEEAGVKARPLKILAIYDRSRHPHEPAFPFHVYKMFILCEAVDGVLSASGTETDAVAFFREDELPEQLSLTRVTPWQIHRMFEHHRNPGLPTDFDREV